MTTLSVTPKTRTITNGTANDGTVPEAEFVELYDNDQTIATFVNNMLGGSYSFTGLSMAGMLQQYQGSNLQLYLGVLNPQQGNLFNVTGTVGAVTSINTQPAGTIITLIFTEAGFILTNSSNLILAGNRNYTTSANDAFSFVSLGGGNWQEVCRATKVFPSLPTKFSKSSKPMVASTSTITMVDILERDHTDTFDIRSIGANVTLSTAGNGLNGIDNGSVAASTMYYLYAVTNGSTVGLIASTVNELASGTISNTNYAYTAKKQIRYAFITDASKNIIPQQVTNWGDTPTITYNTTFSWGNGTATGVTQLSGSPFDSTTFQTVSAAAFVPPFSTKCQIHYSFPGNGAEAMFFRATGSGITYPYNTNNNNAGSSGMIDVLLNTSQQFDYYFQSADNTDFDVFSYTIDGFP
jgi:hypothetical protein